jgi:serine/threonine protein kinase/DNA-binding winged helix-turn-helix (wHTH) protein
MTSRPDDTAATLRDTSAWRFGEAELDESRLELRVRGALVDIERKPLELLMLLLRQPGEVVTKEELNDTLWAGRVVSDSVLTKCMAKLRQALGDSEQTQILTAHGYGYRLMLPVTRLASRKSPAPPPPSGLKPGDSPPLRPNWRFAKRFPGARGENWLAEHVKTGESRVFKMATDADGLAQIKREITLHRLIRESLGQRDDLVRVLDWNLEEVPYFLEVDYCAQGDLAAYFESRGGAAAVPLATRLDLVARTAEALAACHSVGVLHKDLKPANIFVETVADAPTIRLGDFGSGRVLEPDRLRALDITRLGFTQTVTTDETTSGTWAYLAPEVVGGQPPTVQSDIYSLGVLLYQVVMGDLRRPLAPGWERDVTDELLREDISATADMDPARRLADAAELARRLRSLATRRIEREAQRAATAEAEQTRRALERSQTRRGWLLAITGVSLAAVLIILTLYMQVQRSRDEAQRQSAAATAINDFLVRDMIGAADAYSSGRPDRSVREVLDDAAREVGRRFEGQPLLEGQVRHSLGNAYTGNAEADKAVEQLLLAVQRIDAAGSAAELRAQVRLDLSETYSNIENAEAGQEILDEALAIPELPAVMELRLRKMRAWFERIAGRNHDALLAMEKTLPRQREVFGADSLEYADTLMKLGRIHQEVGDYESAVENYQQSLTLKNRLLGPDHPRSIPLAYSLSTCLFRLGRVEEAEKLAVETVQGGERTLGAEHPATLNAVMTLASLRAAQQNFTEAIALGERVLDGSLKVYGEKHLETLNAMNNLAGFYADSGLGADSHKLLVRGLHISRALYGAEHTQTLFLTHNLARSHMDLDEWSAASALQSQLLVDMQREWGAHPNRAWILAAHAWTLSHLGRRDEALRWIEEAIRVLTLANGAEHESVVRARERREKILNGRSGINTGAGPRNR